MAEEELEEVGADDKPSGKGKIIIFGILGVVLVIASIVGTLFFLGTFSDSENSSGEAETVEGGSDAIIAKSAKGKAIYFPLRPPMVVAFPARGRQRFLQVAITLMAREQSAIDAVQFHLPRIRNNLTMLLGAQDYEHLQTIRGKEELRIKCLEEIQTILMQEIKKKGIEDIFFTNLVMQ